jgi:hypothetical protein
LICSPLLFGRFAVRRLAPVDQRGEGGGCGADLFAKLGDAPASYRSGSVDEAQHQGGPRVGVERGGTLMLNDSWCCPYGVGAYKHPHPRQG